MPLLVVLRKAKNLSQEELGVQIARHLGRSIGVGYGQKKISRYESGAAAPTMQELDAIAHILGVSTDEIELPPLEIRKGAPSTTALPDLQLPSGEGKALMALCCLGRPRTNPLDAAWDTLREKLKNGQLWIAVFCPYPNTVDLGLIKNQQDAFEDGQDEITHLEGAYVNVRMSLDKANLNFFNTLDEGSKKRIALYFPKPAVFKSSALLIPPVVRQQYSLTVQKSGKQVVEKILQTWTPVSAVADVGKPLQATGVYPLLEQVSLWESYFGGVLRHWIEDDEEFTEQDLYWRRVR